MYDQLKKWADGLSQNNAQSFDMNSIMKMTQQFMQDGKLDELVNEIKQNAAAPQSTAAADNLQASIPADLQQQINQLRTEIEALRAQLTRANNLSYNTILQSGFSTVTTISQLFMRVITSLIGLRNLIR